MGENIVKPSGENVNEAPHEYARGQNANPYLKRNTIKIVVSIENHFKNL